MNDQTRQRRLTAADFHQELLDLYYYYVHVKILKRGLFQSGRLEPLTSG